MPIKFYRHGPEPTDANELRAFCHVARLLHRQYGQVDEDLILIANLQPDLDDRLAGQGLPQLDGLLLASDLVALLEFKSYFHPIRAQSKQGRWSLVGGKRGQKYVLGGSHPNPYLQVKAAKKAWADYLQQTAAGQPWHNLHAFVLFHPYLHPESQLASLDQDNYWCHISSIDQIVELVLANKAQGIQLSSGQMHRLAFTTLRARPWPEIAGLLTAVVGHLYLQEPGAERPLPVTVYAFDNFTLGRHYNSHRLALTAPCISRDHLRVEVRETAVRIYDLGSKNGSYLEDRPVDGEQGMLLQAGDVVYLGGRDGKTAVRLWFEPVPGRTVRSNVPLPYTETN